MQTACGVNSTIYLLCAYRKVSMTGAKQTTLSHVIILYAWLQISTGQISWYISLTCLHFHFLSWISISPPFQMSNSTFSTLKLDYVTTHLTEEMGTDWTSIFTPPHYPSQRHLDHNCCLPFSWNKWSLIPSKLNPSTTLLPSQGILPCIQTPLSKLSVSTSSILNKYALG